MKPETFRIVNESKLNELGDTQNIRTIADTNASNLNPEDVCKMAVMMKGLYWMLARTKGELHGYFTLREADVILQALLPVSIEIHECYSPKSQLISNVSYLAMNPYINEQWNINGRELVKKLKVLTEFQAFAVLSMVNEIREADDGKTDNLDDEKVKRIFYI